MAYDYGFDLPDTRHSFYDINGELTQINIVRHWYTPEEDDEPTFKCSFDIVHGRDVTHLPIGCDEEKAYGIAHNLYEEDAEATDDYNDTEAMYAAERRMGA